MGCGVLGIVLNKKSDTLPIHAREGLRILNHRGETSHGFSYLGEDGRLVTRKSMGLVSDSRIFDEPFSGSLLIGHTRYTTSSESNLQNAQPIHLTSRSGVEYALSHNGNIANSGELKAMLRLDRAGISDTVVLGNLLGDSVCAAHLDLDPIRAELSRVVGSYSLAIAVAGPDPKLIALRDGHGYMPLSVGSNQDGFFVASETVALGKKYLNAIHRPVNPGEMVVIGRHGMNSYQLLPPQQRQHCMFQWVYKCRPDSEFEGRNVYMVRRDLGFRMAGRYRPDVDCVVPVPESGIAFSYGYSQARGIPLEMGLVKDRYERKRSFMQEGPASRKTVLDRKLNVIGAVVAGKSILIMDDSLVRGLTTTKTIFDLRAEGAKEVHVAFSCPPIISQCHFGVDFYNRDLVARQYSGMAPEDLNAAIARRIGADSVYYARLDDLVAAIGIPESDLCISCLTGKYVQEIRPESEESRKS